MFELVYCSKASPDLSSKDITDILKTARDFNSKHDITGCLLYHANEFIQILEGDKEVILDLIISIKKDKRHQDFRLLAQNIKEERSFPSWNMAFHEFDSNELEKKFFKSNIFAFSELANKPTSTVSLFWNVARELVEG